MNDTVLWVGALLIGLLVFAYVWFEVRWHLMHWFPPLWLVIHIVAGWFALAYLVTNIQNENWLWVGIDSAVILICLHQGYLVWYYAAFADFGFWGYLPRWWELRRRRNRLRKIHQ